MKTLQIRRHTQRTKPGPNLSQKGIDLANQIGKTIGPFDPVLTSNIPRAVQTAVAFGCAVDKELPYWGTLPPKCWAEISDCENFSDLIGVVEQRTHAHDFAQALLHQIRQIFDGFEDGKNALLVTHGGFPELSMLAIVSDLSRCKGEKPFGYCEGINLTQKDGQITARFLRVPEDQYQFDN